MMRRLKPLLLVAALMQSGNLLAYAENFEGTALLPDEWSVPTQWVSSALPSANRLLSSKDGGFAVTALSNPTPFSGKSSLMADLVKTALGAANTTAVQSPFYYLMRKSDLSFHYFIQYKGNDVKKSHLIAQVTQDGGKTWKGISAVSNLTLSAKGRWQKVTLKDLPAKARVAVRMAAYNVGNVFNKERVTVGLDEFSITPSDGSSYKDMVNNVAQAQLYKGYKNTSPTQNAAVGGLPVQSSISHHFTQKATVGTPNKLAFVSEFNTGGDANLNLVQCELRIKMARFDDSLVLKKGTQVVFKLLQKHYENNKKINALYLPKWQPWSAKRAGSPELVLNNDGMQLWVTNEMGSRINILPLVERNAKGFVVNSGAFNCETHQQTQWELQVANTNADDTVYEDLDVRLRLYVESAAGNTNNGHQGAPVASSASAGSAANKAAIRTGINGVGSFNLFSFLGFLMAAIWLRRRI